jgi:hypothetical protein
LGLLIDAEHDRTVRRIEVETDERLLTAASVASDYVGLGDDDQQSKVAYKEIKQPYTELTPTPEICRD